MTALSLLGGWALLSVAAVTAWCATAEVRDWRRDRWVRRELDRLIATDPILFDLLEGAR